MAASAHPRRPRPDRPDAPLGLEALGVLLIAGAIVAASLARSHDPADDDVLDQVLPAILLLSGVVAAIAAAALAARVLLHTPPATTRGRWAVRVALVPAVVIPLVTLGAAAIARLTGGELGDGYGAIAGPLWLASTIVAVLFGASARESDRRGLLVVPLVLGALILSVVVAEFVAIP